MDTQGHDAEWWAEQCKRFKAETDTANAAADRASADLKAAESAHADALAKLRADLTAAHQSEQSRLIQDYKNRFDQLKADQDLALKAAINEHPEVRKLREQHMAEAKQLAESQQVRVVEFRKKMAESNT